MGRSITCDLDAFARSIEELVGDIPSACQDKVGDAVAKSTRKGVKAVKSHASKGGKHEWSGEYVDGFSSHVTRGEETVGEIGNKNKPGLVHLLEKGHATLTGRRTNAYPHLAPAFDEIQEDFIRSVEEAVGEALEG